MPKSKHNAKKKKRHYNPKNHVPIDVFPIHEETEDEPSQEIKDRLISKSGIPELEIVMAWNIVPEKMSEILLDYAEPLLADEHTEDSITEMEKALMAAVMVWNSVIIKHNKAAGRMKLLNRFKMSVIPRLFLRAIGKKGYFSMMVKRKQKLYPDNHRIIASVDVHWDKEIDGPHVVVASTPNVT